MKKAIFGLLSICIVLTICVTASCIADTTSTEEKTIVLKIDSSDMVVNGTPKTIDAAPVIRNSRTLLPVRAVVEELGGEVIWNSELQQATLKYGSDTIVLTVDSTQAIVNDDVKSLDTAPMILDGRTFLPIRFIAENFGFKAEWNGEEQTITISKEYDANTENEVTADNENGSNILIAYFSLSGSSDHSSDVDASTSASLYIGNGQRFGTTEMLAHMIQENVGGDLFKIETDKEYSSDFDTVIAEAREERNLSERPVITNKVENMDKYDTVFIGFPIWSMTTPNVILTFLEEYDLSGKTVVPFCTHDGYGSGSSFNVVDENAKNANVNTEGLAIASDDIIKGDITEIEAEVKSWTEGLGLVSEDTGSENTPINIKIGDRNLTGYLNNTPEAEQFKAMLPITVSMSGFGGREYYGGIDGDITDSAEGKLNFENGDITWCSTNDTVAIFYAQTDRPNLTMRVISMGKVTSDLSVFYELDSSEDITFELAENSKKILIAYFTWADNVDLTNPQNVDVDAVTSASLVSPGNIEKLADRIQKQTDGDVFKIIVKDLYQGDYDGSVARARDELSQNARPELANNVENMEDYDIIFLGYPTWIGACPMAVRTFLENYNFSGKTVIPFCTHGTSGTGTSIEDIKTIIPNTELKKEFSVYRSDVDSCGPELYQWVNNVLNEIL